MQPPVKAEPKVTLYLQNWQKRMLKDFTTLKAPERITKVIIQPGKTGCPTSYKVLPDFMKRDEWGLYLTDEQMLQVGEAFELETHVAVLNITHEGLKSGAVAFV